MDIEVSDVSYYVDINGGEKRLLNSVTAAFWKGMVTILMGHSGAGIRYSLHILHLLSLKNAILNLLLPDVQERLHLWT